MVSPAVVNGQKLTLALQGLGLTGTSGTLKVMTGDAPWSLDITDQVAEFVEEAKRLSRNNLTFTFCSASLKG